MLRSGLHCDDRSSARSALARNVRRRCQGRVERPQGVSDSLDIFTHGTRHIGTGSDPVSGVITNIGVDIEDGSSPTILTGSFANILSVVVDTTGRSSNSTILCFAVLQAITTGGTVVQVEYQFKRSIFKL